MTTTTKAELKALIEAQKELIVALEKKSKTAKNSVNVTGKIIAGTDFTLICKTEGFSVSFMPTNPKYATPSLWLSKNGKNGIAIPATKKGLDSLVAVCAMVEEKAELTA
tara:strand:+ start:153 stop:479 length:327 start_codon:yes stop_codon:yes gene_type:complete